MPTPWIVKQASEAHELVDYGQQPSLIAKLMGLRRDLAAVAKTYRDGEPEYAARVIASAAEIGSGSDAGILTDAYALLDRLERLLGETGRLLADRPRDEIKFPLAGSKQTEREGEGE